MISVPQKKTYEGLYLLRAAFPLMLSNLAGNGISFFSTFFLAHLGEQELIAGTISLWVYSVILIVIWGTMCSVSIMVARSYGADDKESVGRILYDSIILALLFSLMGFAVVWNMSVLLAILGQSPSIVILSKVYFHALAWGLLPDFIGFVLIQFLIGIGHTKTNLIFTLIWVPITISLNWLLVFGDFKFLKLGIVGLGLGTSLAYWITTPALMLYILMGKQYKPYLDNFFCFRSPIFLKRLLSIGFPIGLMYCIELVTFLILNLLMSSISNDLLISNQIVLQYINQTMPIMFAIGQSVGIRIGHTIGSNKKYLLRKITYLGIIFSFLITLFIVYFYCFFPEILVTFDLNKDSRKLVLLDLIKPLFVMGAFFQLIESIRVILLNVLRALQDTLFSMSVSLCGFWFFGLPVGYLFAVFFKMGGQGLWLGLIMGCFFSAIFMLKRILQKTTVS